MLTEDNFFKQVEQIFIESGELDYKINTVLEKIGKLLGVSRVYIFEDDDKGGSTSNTYEWCNTGILPQKEVLQNISYRVIPSWRKFLKKDGRIYCEDIFKLPEDLIDVLMPQGIKSLVVYPCVKNNEILGFVGFDECCIKRKWLDTELTFLKTLAELLTREIF
ncbi:MAG: GAF domain-containing protein [Deltaproteobacteria bacterium]|nr:GAF domain-containing protein [Deltaproteobacteria bacterium]